MDQQFNNIINNFGIWLKLLDKDVVADELSCPRSRIYRYTRLTREELMTKVTLFEVLALEEYVNSLGFDFTDAPDVHRKETCQLVKVAKD